MTSTLEMPTVSACAMEPCAYNHNGCHAFAITISEEATCATFAEMPTKGGIGQLAQVGACVETNCKHNQNLECHAPAIHVGSVTAECQTFEARS